MNIYNFLVSRMFQPRNLSDSNAIFSRMSVFGAKGKRFRNQLSKSNVKHFGIASDKNSHAATLVVSIIRKTKEP